MINVTWNDATAMAKWLSEREGVTYRLPTEAEWEYAARGGTRTRFPAGDDPDVLLRTANTFDREAALRWPRWREQAGTGSDGHAFTAPVGSFAPNAFGLYDMVGNVWEWVADTYHENYKGAPNDGSIWGRLGDGKTKVLRGGSWYADPDVCRSAYRGRLDPDDRYDNIGARVVVGAR